MEGCFPSFGVLGQSGPRQLWNKALEMADYLLLRATQSCSSTVWLPPELHLPLHCSHTCAWSWALMVQIWTLICALYSWLNLFLFTTDLLCDHCVMCEAGYHSHTQLTSFRCWWTGLLLSRLLPCCLCCSPLLLAPPYLWNGRLSLLPHNHPRYPPILQDCHNCQVDFEMLTTASSAYTL